DLGSPRIPLPVRPPPAGIRLRCVTLHRPRRPRREKQHAQQGPAPMRFYTALRFVASAQDSSFPPQLPIKPCAAQVPFALHRSLWRLERISRLFHAQPAKGPQLNDPALAQVNLGKLLERIVKSDEFCDAVFVDGSLWPIGAV